MQSRIKTLIDKLREKTQNNQLKWIKLSTVEYKTELPNNTSINVKCYYNIHMDTSICEIFIKEKNECTRNLNYSYWADNNKKKFDFVFAFFEKIENNYLIGNIIDNF